MVGLLEDYGVFEQEEVEEIGVDGVLIGDALGLCSDLPVAETNGGGLAVGDGFEEGLSVEGTGVDGLGGDECVARVDVVRADVDDAFFDFGVGVVAGIAMCVVAF